MEAEKTVVISKGGSLAELVLPDLRDGLYRGVRFDHSGVFREIPYGEGHVDFPGAIETVWALGVRRFVTEFWYDKTIPDWQGELLKARSRFTALLDAMD